MGNTARIEGELRDRILSRPEVILDDRDVMRALVGANDRAMGGNIIDLRGIAMDRLEARLDRLEDTHRTVIAAAYDNVAGTQSIHRAVLQLLDAGGFEAFLAALSHDVPGILRVDAMRLVLETRSEADDVLDRLGGSVLCVADPGFVEAYMALGRPANDRPIILRSMEAGQGLLFGKAGDKVQSEALIRLDLGPRRLPAMLAMGSADPSQFRSGQGTDLLAFFGGVFERTMRRWLG